MWRLVLLLFFLGEARFRKLLVKLIDTTGSIHKLHLTREEWVRISGNFQLCQWLFLTVFPGDRVFCGHAGAGHKGITGREIFEDYHAVVFGMKIIFHCARYFSFLKRNAKIGFFDKQRKF